MRHEKIIEKGDTQYLLTVEFIHLNIRIEYRAYLVSRAKGKRKWSNIIATDNTPYSSNEPITKYLTMAQLHEAYLELWETLKPSINTHGKL